MHRAPPANATHDLLLVFDVAAAVLGVVLVCNGMPLAEPRAHGVPRAHAVLTPAERDGAALGRVMPHPRHRQTTPRPRPRRGSLAAVRPGCSVCAARSLILVTTLDRISRPWRSRDDGLIRSA